ncbi:MAG: IS5 family transposase [Candidatus Limnocylindria bacterium]
MRGPDIKQSAMFSYLSPEQRVPADHPLRKIREITDQILKSLSCVFGHMYARVGRRSIPPEQLCRALLLQVLYTIRSERMLMEQLEYNLLFRWFVGLNMDDPVWDVTVFTKNRQRFLKADIATKFFQRVVEQARRLDLMSDEHFTVDGTLLEACAALKSFQRKDGGEPPPPDDPGNPTVDFHGEKRSNETHASTTDPEAMLARKGNGKEAKLSYNGNVLMENRNGLVADVQVLPATGTAEREAALMMIGSMAGADAMTVGADKGYDTKQFVAECRQMNATPHVAQKARHSAVDARTTRHPGYGISQQKRKRVEEIFGWIKTVGGMRKLRHRGLELVSWMFTLAAAAYNLVRIRNLSSAIQAERV